MTAIVIRALAPSDIPSVLQIQRSSREAAQWYGEAYCAVVRSDENTWVAEWNGTIAGFCVARIVVADIEILNLVVHKNHRRLGIGSALLNRALFWGMEKTAQRAFLEVRLSNTGAQKFYEAHGFSAAGRRRNYYRAPDEDALVLARVLGAA